MLNNKKSNYYLLISCILYVLVSQYSYSILHTILSKQLAIGGTIFVQMITTLLLVILAYNGIQQKTEKSKSLLVPLFIFLDILYQIIYQNIFSNVGSTTNQSEIVSLVHSHPQYYWFLFLLIVITGPIAEEIVFQRVIQFNLYGLLKKRPLLNNFASRFIAIIGATLLFMLFHIWGDTNASWLELFTNGDLILFAIIYDLTRFRLVFPIATHIGVNLIVFLVSFH